MSLANIEGKLSVTEMEQIMAGSGDWSCWAGVGVLAVVAVVAVAAAVSSGGTAAAALATGGGKLAAATLTAGGVALLEGC